MTRISFPQELVDQCRDGEKEAQFEFYRLVRLYILRICASRYTLPFDDVEDVIQNISISLHRNLDGIHEDVHVWVNAAINRQLAKRARRAATTSLPAQPTTEPTLSVESALGIQEALQRLNAFCKRLLLVHIVHGYTRQETAKAVGIPYGSLPYRRKECLAALYEHYHGGPSCENTATASEKS